MKLIKYSFENSIRSNKVTLNAIIINYFIALKGLLSQEISMPIKLQ